MNIHIAPVQDTAAAQAFEYQAKMEEHLLKIRDLSRVFLQFGTQEDAVPDDRDRLAFMTLSGFVDDMIDRIEELRGEIYDCCYEARYGHPRQNRPVAA